MAATWPENIDLGQHGQGGKEEENKDDALLRPPLDMPKPIYLRLQASFGDVVVADGRGEFGELFRLTKVWTYRFVSALIAIPLSVLWAVVFAVFAALYLWIIAPALRIFEFLIFIARRLSMGIARVLVEPVALAAGAVFARVKMPGDKEPAEKGEVA